jgi:hypothetical protein
LKYVMSHRRLVTAAFVGLTAVAATLVALAEPAAAIIGGTAAQWSDYPYLVLVSAPEESCLGAVISDSWVLTADHCMDHRGPNDPPGDVFVTLPSPPPGSADQFTAQQIIPHPLWDHDAGHGHDLTLIGLPAGALAGIPPVQVGSPWDPGAYAAGVQATIMGPDSNSLAFTVAQVPLLSDSAMRAIGFAWVDPLMIGAGSPQQTTCFGDSGGPLVVNRGGRPVEVGVVSFGTQQCNNAAGFAELSGPQLAWVASNVPSIMSGWGGCTASDGNPGRPSGYYGATLYAGGQPDGPNYWSITCQIIGVMVPNVLGMDQSSAEYYLSGGGLNLGSVSYHYDCASPGDVETQNPSGGVIVDRGTSVNISVSACSSGGGGGGGSGGDGGSGGGGSSLNWGSAKAGDPAWAHPSTPAHERRPRRRRSWRPRLCTRDFSDLICARERRSALHGRMSIQTSAGLWGSWRARQRLPTPRRGPLGDSRREDPRRSKGHQSAR